MASLLVRRLDTLTQPARHIGKQLDERGRVRLVESQLGRDAAEIRRQLIREGGDVGGDRLGQAEDLVPQFRVGAALGLVQFAQGPVQIVEALLQVGPEYLELFGALGALGLDLLVECLDFLFRSFLKMFEPLIEVGPHSLVIALHAFVHLRETAIQGAHLPTKQDVADLLEVGRCLRGLLTGRFITHVRLVGSCTRGALMHGAAPDRGVLFSMML